MKIFAAPLALLILGGCSAGADTSPNRLEYLASGAPVYIYDRLSATPEALPTDLRVGVAEGPDEYMLGDIRSVDVDGDGNIYVFDAQAMMVRVFDGAGRYLRTIASQGMGPGEITRGTGIQIAGDTTLWIQDPGRYAMTAVALDGGGEVATAPMPIRRFGYVWDGGVDGAGRVWQPSNRNLDPHEGLAPTESGPLKSEVVNFVVRRDLFGDTLDTLDLAVSEVQSYAVIQNRGFSMYQVPFSPAWTVRVAQSGDTWHANTSTYRLAGVSPVGDTLVVIQVDQPADRVTDEDAREVRERMAEAGQQYVNIGSEIAALMPEYKPLLLGFWLDHEGRVWVRVGSDQEAPARFDVFESDGSYLKSVLLDEVMPPYLNPSIRGGRLYGITTDSLGAPVVFRTAELD
ncbi:MAG: sugar lactone lactonase YvrE [Rhodothermales bacterium]|jgi:sugar lactone lactonase YvrE